MPRRAPKQPHDGRSGFEVAAPNAATAPQAGPVTGQAGARVTIARHGYEFWRGLMDAKGRQAPRQVGVLDGLRAGRALADLDRAA
jgi:hypothetical protein